eukprot:22630-Hanusia_phi.AAC.2
MSRWAASPARAGSAAGVPRKLDRLLHARTDDLRRKKTSIGREQEQEQEQEQEEREQEREQEFPPP